MELLIVGAGAIGSSYGYLASQSAPAGSVRITYFVKPKHRADLAGGIQLYAWKSRSADAVTFRDFDCVDSLDGLRKRRFDAVLITLPSDKFRAEGWLTEFLKSFREGSPEARIWSLQPGLSDQEFLAAKAGPDAEKLVVKGQIPIMGYLAPLPGEPFARPGYAFYIPPLMKAAWSSKNKEAAREAAALFDAGGLPSKVTTGATPNALPEALLRAVVAGLERSEWSFDRLENGEAVHLASGALREMTAITAKHTSARDPGAGFWGKAATSPFAIRSALSIVRKIVPFDFEAFMRVHFTKVETQMHQHLDEYIELGKRLGLSTTNLVLLRGRKKEAKR